MNIQRREFLYSNDMADACVFLMENRDFLELNSDAPVVKTKEGCQDTHINIGTGVDVSIGEPA